ncbi:MAG: M1 family aminopeptidase, partial [Candidatus Promineifilaceae bacterium]
MSVKVQDGRSRRSALASFDPSIPAQYPPDLLLEPLHLDIDLQVDIAGEQAAGRVVTTVIGRGWEADKLVLDAVGFEDVAVRDVDGHAVTWHYDGQKLTIRWAEPFAKNEQRRVEVAYQIVKPVDGLIFSGPDAAYPDRARYVVTDHESERARYWLPCVDLPQVRTTLDFFLRAGTQMTILANGALVDEVDHDDGTKTAHWRLEQRCPSYLICFAIGEFVTFDDGIFDGGQKQVPLAYFCTSPHTAEDLQRTFGPTREIMAWLTTKLRMPFPYPKYYQFAVPRALGAMENISLTSWGSGYVQDAALAKEIGYRVDLVNLHEMAHSYFGDAIVCRDFAHTWLKESWAVYMEQCWLEETASKEERDYQYFGDAQRYFDEADNRYKRPIVTRHFRSSWEMFDAHTYPGGACRLHTLREEIGSEVFWEAVRDYLKRYYGEVVETDQFRLVLEEHSGRSLGQFFDQWFYTAGYPDLHVSFNYDENKQQGTFEVEQKQVDDKENIPPFVLNCDLGWVIDGTAYLTPVMLEKERQTFVINMPAAPQQVRFDPYNKVLHKLTFNPGATMLRSQLRGAPDVIGRIQAAKTLVEIGNYSAIEAVVEAYEDESFWGVRLEMARALAQANHEAAVAGLARLVRFEQDPMVMAGLFEAAGAYRDDRIRQALQARLDEPLPYHAQRAALEALGKQRQEAPLELLLAEAQKESFNGIVQAGALQALAATRQPEVIDALLARVPYGATPEAARPAAVRALGDTGKGQEKARREQIIEALIDLLRDPSYLVHRSAANSLRTMKAVEALPALEAYTRRLSFQDQVIL